MKRQKKERNKRTYLKDKLFWILLKNKYMKYKEKEKIYIFFFEKVKKIFLFLSSFWHMIDKIDCGKKCRTVFTFTPSDIEDKTESSDKEKNKNGLWQYLCNWEKEIQKRTKLINFIIFIWTDFSLFFQQKNIKTFNLVTFWSWCVIHIFFNWNCNLNCQ